MLRRLFGVISDFGGEIANNSKDYNAITKKFDETENDFRFEAAVPYKKWTRCVNQKGVSKYEQYHKFAVWKGRWEKAVVSC